MQAIPYLNFKGQCEAAFKFYEKCLGGKIEAMMPFAGSPAEQFAPAGWGDKIMHATLVASDVKLMGSDAPPDRFQQPQGFSVALQLSDTAEAERIFKALSEGGNVLMPLEETFWAARFGMFVDKFGTPWMINCAAAG